MQHTYILETGLNYLTVAPRSGKVMTTIEDKAKKNTLTLVLAPEETQMFLKALNDASYLAQVAAEEEAQPKPKLAS